MRVFTSRFTARSPVESDSYQSYEFLMRKSWIEKRLTISDEPDGPRQRFGRFWSSERADEIPRLIASMRELEPPDQSTYHLTAFVPSHAGNPPSPPGSRRASIFFAGGVKSNQHLNATAAYHRSSSRLRIRQSSDHLSPFTSVM